MAKRRRKRRKKQKRRKDEEGYFEKRGIEPDYKDVLILRRFITDRGKILSQDKTGVNAENQRSLTKAVKRARYMALLPYTDRHMI